MESTLKSSFLQALSLSFGSAGMGWTVQLSGREKSSAACAWAFLFFFGTIVIGNWEIQFLE